MNHTLAKLWRDAIPPAATKDPIGWMERNVQMIGSARSSRCNFDMYPWTREPVERAALGECRTVTLVKPVQSGGSGASEALACYWIACETGNFWFHWNWQDDTKALQRWSERIEPILQNCGPLMAKAPTLDRQAGRWKARHVLFPHCKLKVQGVKESKNLDSDTVRFEINEEIHDWEPGRLAKAYNRTTAVWNAIIFNVSNASKVGDQLHQAFSAGTQQAWEVLCPHCRKFHVMRTRWDDRRPDLGGLRYDADGCRTAEGYNYNRLERTIRYQMPCGGEIREDPAARRALSRSGRYGAPGNTGAKLKNRSYTLEAVAVDYIPFLTLIQEKHAAMRAMRLGDPEDWWRYIGERENQFVDPRKDRPSLGSVVINTKIKKNRDGLPNRVARFGALDRQRGTFAKGETPHWWGVIRDVDADGNSLLVWEGKCHTDEDAARIMSDHDVRPSCVVVDSGDLAKTHVYRFCLRYGFNAIKGRPDATFAHEDGSRKIFSPERPLHLMLNKDATKDDPLEEPLFWLYSKSGIRERLHWLRGANGVRWEVPGDVSEDYKAHMESEEIQKRIQPRTGETIEEFIQIHDRNDLYVCECYIAMLMDQSGLIAVSTEEEEEKINQFEKLSEFAGA